jgi:hypothetical protein
VGGPPEPGWHAGTVTTACRNSQDGGRFRIRPRSVAPGAVVSESVRNRPWKRSPEARGVANSPRNAVWYDGTGSRRPFWARKAFQVPFFKNQAAGHATASKATDHPPTGSRDGPREIGEAGPSRSQGSDGIAVQSIDRPWAWRKATVATSPAVRHSLRFDDSLKASLPQSPSRVPAR